MCVVFSNLIQNLEYVYFHSPWWNKSQCSSTVPDTHLAELRLFWPTNPSRITCIHTTIFS
jgi:hypothetical protein